MENSESCDRCGKTFKNKYILKTHMQSSKSCLKIEGKQLEDKFSCDTCKKKYTTNQNLRNHKCKPTPTNTTPTTTTINNTTNNINNNTTNNNTTNNNNTNNNNNTTNNNTNNNNTTINNITNNNTTINITIKPKKKKKQVINDMASLDLREESLRKKFKKLNSKHLNDEIQGIAQFTVFNIFEIDPDNNGNRNYICVDGSRYIAFYKDFQTGSIIKDPSFKKLLKAVINQACERGNEIIDDYIDGFKIRERAELRTHLKNIEKNRDKPLFKKIIAEETAIKL